MNFVPNYVSSFLPHNLSQGASQASIISFMTKLYSIGQEFWHHISLWQQENLKKAMSLNGNSTSNIFDEQLQKASKAAEVSFPAYLQESIYNFTQLLQNGDWRAWLKSTGDTFSKFNSATPQNSITQMTNEAMVNTNDFMSIILYTNQQITQLIRETFSPEDLCATPPNTGN